jgi:hypothetical protein
MNNPDGGYRIATRVNVATTGSTAGNSSPVSTLPVIVLCPIGGICTFPILASDPNADPLTFRLSTPAEASAFAPNPNSFGIQ